jgi:hypothetical protein
MQSEVRGDEMCLDHTYVNHLTAVYVLIYGLFDNTLNSSNYIAINSRVITWKRCQRTWLQTDGLF